MAITNQDRVGKALELLKEGLRPFDDAGPHILRVERARGDRRAQCGVQIVGDRDEKVALVGEVVVERTARDARLTNDLFGRCLGIPLLREQLASSLEEGAPRRFCVLVSAALRGHRPITYHVYVFYRKVEAAHPSEIFGFGLREEALSSLTNAASFRSVWTGQMERMCDAARCSVRDHGGSEGEVRS